MNLQTVKQKDGVKSFFGNLLLVQMGSFELSKVQVHLPKDSNLGP